MASVSGSRLTFYPSDDRYTRLGQCINEGRRARPEPRLLLALYFPIVYPSLTAGTLIPLQ